MDRPCAISPSQQMTTAVSAKAPRRNGKTTHLVHVPVIVGNQLLNRWTGSRSRSYGKMAGRDSADGNSPGGFLDRVARQMPLSLHSAATLPFSPSLIQSQRLFLKFLSALSCVMQMVAKEVFSLWPQVPARNPNRKSPARRALSTVEPPTQKKSARSARLSHGQP
jgi:hypothetical protein